MDAERKAADPTLVCTCNDLYIEDIEDAFRFGEDEYREVFAALDTQPRCGECQCHVAALISDWTGNKKPEEPNLNPAPQA